MILAVVIGLAAICVAAISTAGGSPLHSTSTGPVALDPAQMAPGACVAYPPSKGNRRRTVFLDAGHGGLDPGGVGRTASGQTITEAKINLPIELAAMKLLRAQGFRVVVSRTRNSTVVRLSRTELAAGTLSYAAAHADVADRDICANLAHASVLVGIYMDAGGPQNAGSVTAYDPDRPFAAANRRFADLLQRDVVSAMNAHGWSIPNGGVSSDSDLGSYVGTPDQGGITAAAASYDHLLLLGPSAPGFFTRPSEMPGAVIEPLYLTDPFEGSIAVSRTGQAAIAAGITRAVDQFLPAPKRRHR